MCSVVNTLALISEELLFPWGTLGSQDHICLPSLLISVSGCWGEARILHCEKVVSLIPALQWSLLHSTPGCHPSSINVIWEHKSTVFLVLCACQKWSSSTQAVTDGSSIPQKWMAKTHSGMWMEAWCLLNGKLNHYTIYLMGRGNVYFTTEGSIA